MIEQRERWRAAGGFLLLALVWLAPVLFPSEGQALGGLDSRGQFYYWLGFAKAAVANGRLPLWNADLFAGYPFLADPQTAFFYPVTWLLLLLPVEAAISLHIALHIAIAGLGMYFFVRGAGGHWIGALLAGITFAFSGFVAARIYAGHIGFLATNSWLPWLLLGLVWSVRRRSAAAGVLAGVPFGLAILAGNPTSLLYTGLIWGLFALFWQWQAASRWFVLRQFGLAFLVGVLLSGVQLVPFLQFSALSSRAASPSFDFSAAFSLPPAHLVTLLVPEFFGEPTRVGYWSVPNFEELTYYAGVLPLLGLILLWKRPSPLGKFYLALIAFGLLLALGRYGFLFPFLYDVLPPFRLFRAPGRAAFLYTFGAAALLGEVVSIWLREPDRTTQIGQWMRWSLNGVALPISAALAATGAAFAAVHPTDTSGRLWVQIGGWGVALLVLLVGGALLWRTLRQERIDGWLVAALTMLVLADLWTFGGKFVRLSPMTPAPLWADVTAILTQEAEIDGRILPWGISIFDQNGAAQTGLQSVFGYNPLEIGANTGFAASVPDPRATTYDILGATTVVSQAELAQYKDGERPLTLLGQQNGTWVYRRSRTLPMARLVDSVEVIADEANAITRVHAPDFDPETTAIVSESPPCELANSGRVPGSATVEQRADGMWQIETNSDRPALLIVSETAYPGWRVWVDGTEAESLVAYTAVRAVCVPASTHVVTWRYQPLIFWPGAVFSIIGILLLGWGAIQIGPISKIGPILRS